MPQDLVGLLLWLRLAAALRVAARERRLARESCALTLALAVLGGY